MCKFLRVEVVFKTQDVADQVAALLFANWQLARYFFVDKCVIQDCPRKEPGYFFIASLTICQCSACQLFTIEMLALILVKAGFKVNKYTEYGERPHFEVELA